MGETEVISLFELFKEHSESTITDPSGRTSTIVMRSLDVFENQRASKKMEAVRLASTKRLDTEEMRTAMLHNYDLLKSDQVIDQIIDMEKPLADDNEDLAPKLPSSDKPGDEAAPAVVAEAPKEEDPKTKEAREAKEKIARWEKDRRAELEPLSDDDLKKLLVDRQIRAMIGMEVITRFMDEQLVRMAVDRKTRPVFSLDYVCSTHPEVRQGERDACEKCGAELEPVANHLARLHPSTLEELRKLRTDFLKGKSDKSLRAMVTAPPSSPSGDLVAAPDGTPGATTATPQLSLTG